MRAKGSKIIRGLPVLGTIDSRANNVMRKTFRRQ